MIKINLVMLSIPQLNLNTTSIVVGFDMKMTVQISPNPPTKTQCYPLGGSDQHLLTLTTTKQPQPHRY